MTYYQQIKHNCKISVEDSDYEPCWGVLVLNQHNIFRFQPYIKISEHLDPYQKEFILMHELGHYQCVQDKCSCLNVDNFKLLEDNILGEVHAHEYCLTKLLEDKRIEALRWGLKKIKELIAPSQSDGHREAAERIVKSELYKKCKEFVERNEKWII